MNIRSKIGLGLILSFLFGGIVGGAAYRVVLRHRIRSVFQARTSGFLNPFRDEILKLTQYSSREAVEAVLAAHGKRMSEIDAGFRDEIETAFKELFKDLAKYLPAEAMKQVQQRFQNPPPRRRGPLGPDGFGGPPPMPRDGGPGPLGPGGPPVPGQGGNPPNGPLTPDGPRPPDGAGGPPGAKPPIKL